MPVKPDNLPVSPEYTSKFHELPSGRKITLKDDISDSEARVVVRASEATVFYARPDGEIIPQSDGQKKADYVIYCGGSAVQVSFIEMKGRNLTSDPYKQILMTLEYFITTKGLQKLVLPGVEKHAFIVSALKQRIPSGLSISERKLLQKLREGIKSEYRAGDFLHYVRYSPNCRYSNNEGRIICSADEPLEFPYKDKER